MRPLIEIQSTNRLQLVTKFQIFTYFLKFAADFLRRANIVFLTRQTLMNGKVLLGFQVEEWKQKHNKKKLHVAKYDWNFQKSENIMY